VFKSTFSTISFLSATLVALALLLFFTLRKGDGMKLPEASPLATVEWDIQQKTVDVSTGDDHTNGAVEPGDRQHIVYMSPRDLAPSPFDDIVNPPATQEEWEALEQSAREFGILNPLIIWGNSGRCKQPVLAGNRRLTVALKLDLDLVPVIFRDFDSKEKAKQFAIRENTERREMTPITRTMAADELWRLFDKAADKKAKAAEGLPPRKRAALAAGTSEGSLASFRYVLETEDADLIKKMLSGELKISAAYREAKGQVEGVPSTSKSTGSAKIDKGLADLKAIADVLRGVSKLSDRIVTGIPKAAGRLKAADKKRIAKELGDAQDFLAKARNDDFLGALEKAIETAKSSVS
jgi:ParB-like chromosome segregation protein Spo0J